MYTCIHLLLHSFTRQTCGAVLNTLRYSGFNYFNLLLLYIPYLKRHHANIIASINTYCLVVGE